MQYFVYFLQRDRIMSVNDLLHDLICCIYWYYSNSMVSIWIEC